MHERVNDDDALFSSDVNSDVVCLHGVLTVLSHVRDARRGNFMVALFCLGYINHGKIQHRSFLRSLLDYYPSCNQPLSVGVSGKI